jgi:hypothetical protein
VRDAHETFGGLESAVESVHLGAQSVEALEYGVQLAVIEVLAVRHSD